MSQSEDKGKLIKGDMVFHLSIEGSLEKFIVGEDSSLTNSDKKINVTEVGTNKKLNVDISKLIVDKGFILAVPNELYNVIEDQVVFHDAVDEVINAVMNKCSNMMCDEDMSLVMDVNEDIVVFNSNDSRVEESGPSEECVLTQDVDDDQLQTSRKKPAKRRRQISSDEDDDDEVHLQKQRIKKGNWVAVQYNNTPFVGIVENVDVLHGFQVHTLDHSGDSNCFKWTTDSIWYGKILISLNEPVPANNRAALKLSDTDYAKFKKLYQ